jgi:uncharacterized protein (DUF1697 family)
MNIALIRGINVAGHKMIAMADLRAMFEALGLSEVKSLLQSGNLVFLAEQARERLALEADFFVRTAEEWDALIAANPFRREAKADPGHLVLMCLKDAPDKKAVTALQAAIVGREVVQAAGRHLYIVFPDGIGRSRLTTALIERTLRTRGTGRNWNTVLKIQALIASG